MRVIGTEPGMRLVELTYAEYDALVSLIKVLDGKPPFTFGHHPDTPLSGDVSEAFIAIRTWINGQYYISEMRGWLDRLEAVLDPEKGKSKIIKAGEK